MSEAQNNLEFIKTKIGNVDETKLKNLEARLIGPNSHGNLPVRLEHPVELDLTILNSSNLTLTLEISNRSENNTLNDIQRDVILAGASIHLEPMNNNSNKSMSNSVRKKNTPLKAQNKTKSSANGNITINYLSTKRNRSDEDDLFKSTDQWVENNIEFSSKNVVSANPLFSNTKENTLNNFVKKSNGSARTYSINTPPINKTIPGNNSETKINEYFKTHNTGLVGNFASNDDKGVRLLKEKVNKLSDENEGLKKELSVKSKLLTDREKDSERLRLLVRENEEYSRNSTSIIKHQESQITSARSSIAKYLKELEENKKSQKKIWLNEQALKLGKFVLQRAGNTIIETWEEGDEYTKIRMRYSTVLSEKEALEKEKKGLLRQPKGKDKNISDNLTGENIEEIYEEKKELIAFKLLALTREENEIKAKMEKLDYEKILYQIEYKRQMEEEKCRYGAGRSKERWPTLSGRYLILSLLGKGGYSEVYKVKLLLI
jgi:hypothetical protein